MNIAMTKEGRGKPGPPQAVSTAADRSSHCTTHAYQLIVARATEAWLVGGETAFFTATVAPQLFFTVCPQISQESDACP
jgi:hypothetical protein